MDFQTLQTEFFATGFDDWNDAGAGLTRAKRIINEAYKSICDAAPWGFLETTASGTAPLTVSDARHVQTVTDNTNKQPLAYLPKDQREAIFPDTPDTGNPEYWTWASDTSIAVYPANTSVTIEVGYLKNPVDLSVNGDTPIVPTRYHDLIVLLATVRAWRYKDASGSESIQTLKQEYREELGEMMQALLVRQSEPLFILQTGS